MMTGDSLRAAANDDRSNRPDHPDRRGHSGRRRIVVVGAGAAGTLTAARLLDRAGRRGLPLEVRLVDPGSATGRGVAYRTEDPRHLLNVPARAISADPDDPEDFIRWLAARGHWADPGSFQPRARYGCYLSDLLGQSAAQAGPAAVLHRDEEQVTGLTTDTGPRALTVALASGGTLAADGVVLAVGQYPPGVGWAPRALRESPRFVADPWTPGALAAVPAEGDVLLVGTGLTMVDAALVLDRPGRALHAVSRTGLMPQAHRTRPAAPVTPPPIEDGADLSAVRRAILRHVSAHRREGGDWQAAFDSLRPVTQRLWSRLGRADQERFLAEDARLWDVHRHRTAPVTGAVLRNLRAAGRLTVAAGAVVAAEPTADGAALLVRLSDGRELRVAAVVNCTGPETDFRRSADPLAGALLGAGLVRPGPFGLGWDTAPDGRVLDAGGRARLPLWTLGASRRGSLWESTAIREIRVQALELASAVLDQVLEPVPGQAPGQVTGQISGPLLVSAQG